MCYSYPVLPFYFLDLIINFVCIGFCVLIANLVRNYDWLEITYMSGTHVNQKQTDQYWKRYKLL